MKCPICQAPLVEAGRTNRCATCDGAWVREDVLVAMLEQSASTLVTLPWRANAEDHVRPCPECAVAMQTVALGTVALDRCAAHGIWFDAEELAALLGQAKKFRASERDLDQARGEHDGLLGRLARLFH